jgi:hypothetical protein
MKKFAVGIAVAGLLAGCVVPETQEGSVYQLTNETVTIRGAFSADGSPAAPTAAMQAQAEAQCAGAQYLSATPSHIHEYDYTFLYLFRCPNGPRR